ncbi:hypothetical protein WJX81_007745 [Elliptochloris bilobata]|uniref:Fungal lipase-type domain-containing protein n=1 Tax=Elliptochloris bilobata TaxID=381761 RepID=A0AAW1SF18_9CHLO
MLVQALAAASFSDVQDAAISLALSEAVYQQLDEGGIARATAAIPALLKQYPATLHLEPLRIRWEHSRIGYQVLVAEGGGALYIAFMGTKRRRDLLTNANAVQAPLWPTAGAGAAEDAPAAHRGFLWRARSVNGRRYLQEAQRRGLRLVFCGHSLGGAVAQLCALDLLQAAQGSGAPPPRVSSVGFATPAVGNAALAERVAARGWGGRFVTYLLPEDAIGAFFNRSWPAGPAAHGRAAPSAKSGQRGLLMRWLWNRECMRPCWQSPWSSTRRCWHQRCSLGAQGLQASAP